MSSEEKNGQPEPGNDSRKAEYLLGIDTGGTYTDGVLLDYSSRHLISSAKHLTTRQDLSIGVTNVIQSLEIPDPDAVQLVGISSTLATNSIAEKKARDVGLILVGYDPELLSSYDLEDRFAARDFAYFEGGHDSQGKERASLDLEGIRQWIEERGDAFDAFAVSSYFSPLNAEHEERTADMIYQLTSRPVVMGHQLSTQLDSVKRATTAALNASLVSVMQEFIESVQTALKEQGVKAPLMVVKGDGSLMPYEEAIHKPVETIVSGPAASAIGGYFLCDENSGLVIDVGGTTTDMALVEDSRMDLADEGASVGGIETAVKTARIRTVGVGCDSFISISNSGREIEVGPERVVPLCRLADDYPHVGKELSQLSRKDEEQRTVNDLEYWFLYRRPSAGRVAGLKEKQQQLVELLLEGPISVAQLMEKMNVYHPVQLNAGPLMRQGYIEKGTLTPTDLLRVQGQISGGDQGAAEQGLSYLASLSQYPGPEAFVREVFNVITATILEEVIVFLAGKEAERLPEQIDGTWGRWFFEEFLADRNPHISVKLFSHFPIVGVGAPAKSFIEDFAEKVGAPLLLPEHNAVANAIGAVVGSVMVEKEALVFVREMEDRRTYTVHVEGTHREFKEEADAHAFARDQAESLAKEGAVSAGAAEPEVTTEKKTEGSVSRVVAQAVGNPDLSSEAEQKEEGGRERDGDGSNE